jgi:hypothetical protein
MVVGDLQELDGEDVQGALDVGVGMRRRRQPRSRGRVRRSTSGVTSARITTVESGDLRGR